MVPSLLVSKVLMPERGVFIVRVDDELALSGVVAVGTKGKFVVQLDYGEDVGTVTDTEPYDSEVHGPRIPGFRLVRPLAEQDEKTISENEALATAMSNAFHATMKETVPDLRIPVARLSFGQKKLFLRYTTENPKPDFTVGQAFLKRQFGVDVNLWAMGPRDEVADLGGLGPCGRVCCCCSWQHRFPSHVAPDRRDSLPSLMNGTCGRFKCCLAFERT